MPNYDYQCEKCDRVFEVFQSMKDPHLKKCTFEGCNGKVKRLLGTGAGFVFKGSGFYITDYRSESYKAAAKNDVAPPATAAPAASSGGESAPKPAAPSAPTSNTSSSGESKPKSKKAKTDSA